MTPADPLESMTLDTSGFRLHYVAQGDPRNELVVLLHPAFGDHRCFGWQLEALAADYRVVALDLPGHGLSQAAGSGLRLADSAALIAAIIAREGHAAAHLVGVSLGSLVAQDVAARYPEAVTSLSVVGGYPIFGADKAIRRAQAKEMLKWLWMIAFSMPRFRRHVVNTSAIDPQAREVFLRSAQLFTRRSLRAMDGLNSIMRPVWQPQRHPLQIIVGQHELPLLRAATAAWHQRESGSEYHVIANAGHCANMDNPGEFNAVLRAFLARRSDSALRSHGR